VGRPAAVQQTTRARVLTAGFNGLELGLAPMDGLVAAAAPEVAQAVRILPLARALWQQSHGRDSITQAWGHSGPPAWR
jgi:hypothetical protein